MAFSFELKLAISSELYGAISAGPEHRAKETTTDTRGTATTTGSNRAAIDGDGTACALVPAAYARSTVVIITGSDCAAVDGDSST